MIGNSWPEWLLIQASVLIFRFNPLLYALLLLGLHAHSALAPHHPSAPPPAHTAAKTALLALLLAEAAFYIFLYRPHLRRAATARAAHPAAAAAAAAAAEEEEEEAAATRQQRRALFERCIAHTADPALYLRGWFLDAPLADVRRDNLREFFLWAFFDMTPDEVAVHVGGAVLLDEVDGYIDALERRIRHSFGEGRGSARSLRLTMDPVATAYRGLAWYAVIALVDWTTHAVLRWHGFRFYARGDAAEVAATFPPRPQELLSKYRSPAPVLSYWYYGPTTTTGQAQNTQKARSAATTIRATKSTTAGAASKQLPIVFLHGIGVGLLTYLRFLIHLIKASKNANKGDNQNQGHGGIRIIAIELLPVSFRLTSPPLDRHAFLDAFTSIIDSHHWDDFCIVSHSYGSVPTSHILTATDDSLPGPSLSSRAKAVVLVDPVTIMLQLPNVAYSFTRRPPRTAAEWQLWYFASADVGVATVLGRHFFWRENIIWRDDLLHRLDGGQNRRVTVSLAAKDIIVNAPAVAQYLAGSSGGGTADGSEPSGIRILWFPELDHAQVFDTAADYKQIIDCVLTEVE